MPELLLELYSEELPARMQARAAQDLQERVTAALRAGGLDVTESAAFAGPRRLTLVVPELAAETKPSREVRKGPRVGAPEKAVEGFLRSVGLSSVEEAEVREDKKGAFYTAVLEKPGRAAEAIIEEAVHEAVHGFAWPKSMRTADRDLRWARPLRSVLCVFGGEAVGFDLDGHKAGNTTFGHRVTHPEPIRVRFFDDYETSLRSAQVMLREEDRQEVIRRDAVTSTQALGLKLVEDEALVRENAGLVEMPFVGVGSFAERFLALPDAVILTVLKSHQKCFAVAEAASDSLAAKFVYVANLRGADGGGAIRAGNERVVRARLSDAQFFWEQDRKKPLEHHAGGLARITFQEKLGSVADKTERVAALARELAPACTADPALTERAARLSKADLVTEMVGEFPELQGQVGGWYAAEDGEDPAIAAAIRDHYKPLGPSDAVPHEPVSIAVSLADKLDTLAGFWAIDEKPTGSKDPYALRRAALGVIRLILENKARLPLRQVLHKAAEALPGRFDADDLLTFFADRLKVALKDQGARYDLIDAVFALGDDDLVRVTRRVEALQSFLSTPDGAALLAGNTRAVSIVHKEEEAGGETFAALTAAELTALSRDESLEDQEQGLASALMTAKSQADTAIQGEDFPAAMGALAGLRRPIDAFFDSVMVNVENSDIRRRRLRLLATIREALDKVADFSRIESV